MSKPDTTKTATDDATTGRVRKTPAQRAQEQYDVAARAATRIEAKLNDLNAEVVRVAAELEQAVARRDYLAKHPDLPRLAD